MFYESMDRETCKYIFYFVCNAFSEFDIDSTLNEGQRDQTDPGIRFSDLENM